MGGLSINIAVDGNYAGPVSYQTAAQLCGTSLYKMGSDYIGIIDQVSFSIDSVVVSVGRRAQSLLFDIVSSIRMQSNSMEKTKTYKVKQLSEADARGHQFVIYKIV